VVVVASRFRSSCFLFLSCLFALVTVLPAAGARAVDPWDPIWERSVREDTGSWVAPPLSAVATDPEGNAYVTGYRVYGDSGTPDGGSSMTLRKYAPGGDLLWRRAWGHPSGFHRFVIGFDVAVAPEGRAVYVAGARFNDSSEDAVPMLWAYSSRGRLRWAHAAWGGRWSAMARAVVARPGGVVVGGFTFGECGPTNGMISAWTVSGDRSWQDRFEPAARDAFGDALHDLAVGPGGGIYAVGSKDLGISSCGPEPTPDVDVMVQRRLPDGRIGWTRVWRDGDAVDDDQALAVTVRGDVIVVGGHRDGYPGRAWLARITPTGAVRWSRTFGPEPPSGARVTSLDVAPWGAVYAVGKAKGAMFLRRYAPTGDVWSERRLDGLTASDVATGRRNAVYVTGGPTLWRMPP
jgi:hypothetical protein